ncbi:MAG: TIGR02206 family membrane protein [Solirubrobacteraceae bacterium]
MRQFSDPHLAALAVLVAATIACVWVARTASAPVVAGVVRTLAVVILAGWAGEYLADVIRGTWSVEYDLPLQLTDAVSLTAVLALWTRRQLLVELLYFWSLTASLQATITPDLGQNFPSIYYFTYFAYHVGAIVGGCMLVFGCGQYPRPRAAWRAFAATLGFAAIAGAADVITGGNYMYLRTKPEHNSLLSVMGPWPWYIVGAALVGLVMLLALQWIADRVRARDRPAVSSAVAG